jgi:signal transduction histidine kinase
MPLSMKNTTHQVLDNLISNAVKYSPLGKNIMIRLLQNETYIRCEIQDEGPGLSEADKKKLFGKFNRLTARPTAGEHSTGLGLFIVKKLLEAMGGRVWCESELGHGATFIVEFPRSEGVQSEGL